MRSLLRWLTSLSLDLKLIRVLFVKFLPKVKWINGELRMMMKGGMGRHMMSLELSMSLMGVIGKMEHRMSLMGQRTIEMRTMEFRMSLMGQSTIEMEHRMSLMEQRTIEMRMMGQSAIEMEHRKSLMGQSTIGMEHRMSLMQHICVQKKLRVSSIGQLGDLEQHVRVQFQQHVLSCIRVDHIEMRFEVGRMKMKLRDLHHDLRLKIHRFLRHQGFLVATRFP